MRCCYLIIGGDIDHGEREKDQYQRTKNKCDQYFPDTNMAGRGMFVMNRMLRLSFFSCHTIMYIFTEGVVKLLCGFCLFTSDSGWLAACFANLKEPCSM